MADESRQKHRTTKRTLFDFHNWNFQEISKFFEEGQPAKYNMKGLLLSFAEEIVMVCLWEVYLFAMPWSLCWQEKINLFSWEQSIRANNLEQSVICLNLKEIEFFCWFRSVLFEPWVVNFHHCTKMYTEFLWLMIPISSAFIVNLYWSSSPTLVYYSDSGFLLPPWQTDSEFYYLAFQAISSLLAFWNHPTHRKQDLTKEFLFRFWHTTASAWCAFPMQKEK